MIHNEGLKVREILKEHFDMFCRFNPDGKFARESENYHRLNLEETMKLLSRDPKTRFMPLEDFTEILYKGVTGEFDTEKSFTPIRLNFKTLKGWILKYKVLTQKIETGGEFQEYDTPEETPDLVAMREAGGWLIHRSIYRDMNLSGCNTFDKLTCQKGLQAIDTDPNPERFKIEKQVLENRLSSL